MSYNSLKMLMVWRNLQRRSCASITTKTLELNAALEGSITFTVLSEHGKVDKQNNQFPDFVLIIDCFTSRV